jgi:hypothetical protein
MPLSLPTGMTARHDMIEVQMTRSDWDTVIMILTDARDSGRFAYFDHIIDSIDSALDKQEG